MLIIGSNIARAFALVGAMSIVRFRNPVKDTRDLVFVFIAIAVGMACGTRFYAYALIFTFFTTFVVFAHQFTNFGIIKSKTYVLRIRAAPEDREKLEDVLHTFSKSFFLISMDRLAGEREMEELVYEIDLLKQHDYPDLVDALSKASKTVSISLLVGESAAEA
jgi:uncharacterized membrane protein YhiD involved in acid resistance